MNRTCNVSINGETFAVKIGDRLLDAALQSGVDLPHDCRSGHCGTCTLRVENGKVLGGDLGKPGMVRACQAHVLTDLEVSLDGAVSSDIYTGKVQSITPRSSDVLEVAVVLNSKAPYRPGQYFKLAFSGLPWRSYSPTEAMDANGSERSGVMRFHIRQFPDGAVSSQFGSRIREGSSVALQGPLGSAFLDPDATNRLVLVSGGTGFAPIWSIAKATMADTPKRPIILVAGARSSTCLYMMNALVQAKRHPNLELSIAVDTGPAPDSSVRVGRPTEFMPALKADDIVHVAGPPPLVDAVSALADKAGCIINADVFITAAEEKAKIARIGSVLNFFRRDERAQGASAS